MKALLIASVLLITSFSSHADSGNVLFRQYQALMTNEVLNADEALEAGRYAGFIDGVVVSFNAVGLTCMPEEVTTLQIYDMVGKYLEENPKERHRNALDIVSEVILEAFDCEE
jgi:hypothetical protein